MIEPQNALTKIEEMLSSATVDDSPCNRAAAFAATTILIQKIRDHIEAEYPVKDAYLLEKLMEAEWHSGAMLGFADDHGHSSDQHHSWALTAVSSARLRIKM